MRDYLVAVAGIVGVLLVLATIDGTASWFATKFDCQIFNESTGTTTKFNRGQCYVEVDGRFIPMDLYKKSFERNLNIRMNQ